MTRQTRLTGILFIVSFLAMMFNFPKALAFGFVICFIAFVLKMVFSMQGNSRSNAASIKASKKLGKWTFSSK